MIHIRTSPQFFTTQHAAVHGMPVFEGTVAAVAEQLKSVYPLVAELAQQRGFTGAKKQTLNLSVTIDNAPTSILLVGVGKADNSIDARELYRRAIGTIVRQAQCMKAASLALQLPDPATLGYTKEELTQETVIALTLANYNFDDFISKDPNDRVADLVDVILCGIEVAEAEIQKAYMIARAVNKARHWIDTPPSMMTPPQLAAKAQEIARHHNLGITVFGEQEVIKMGMGGLAAVSRGSDIDCQLVIMEYKTEKPNAPMLAFVGKGITFDSGGLSIKPARSMETMKEDMSGAAAVIASMEVLAQLKPAVNIVALAPMSENLPSGKATKPGDIIRFYNGKTAEVRNTDAEGRLILADALSYAVKHYKPDAIIDLATLTGACSYALGPYFAGMMSMHDDFVAQVQKAADRTGDRVWRLPLHDDYKAAIKSTVADICNIGNEKIMAGTITAAHFLQNFVNDTPWVHLDIAGTAFDVPGISYFRDGATGYGVRLLIDLASNWKSKK
jgi:leucyl aminopeptidase